jgi:predicted acylesterase/phospholipase RssA
VTGVQGIVVVRLPDVDRADRPREAGADVDATVAIEPEESPAEARDALEHARSLVAGGEALPSHGELERLVARLEARGERSLARDLVLRASEASPDGWSTRRLAAFALRDEDETLARRHADALDLLEGVGLRTPASAHPETLRLGALVYEGKWESEGRVEHLETALALYLAPWERDPDEDRGRGGAGAARVLDRMAAYARRSERPPDGGDAAHVAARARALRWRILAHVPGRAEDRTSTMLAIAAETHFGIGDYEKAGEYLAQVRVTSSPEGEEPAGPVLRDTFRRLATLAVAQDVDVTDTTPGSAGWRARKALERLAGESAVLRGAPEEVGLALAGGGLRAAFCHLGVLARLAESGILPSVEILSTVSGGSLVGAQYYLEVRRLLQAKGDDAIVPYDYVEIVQRLIPLFVSVGQSNVRMRTLSDATANLRAIVSTAESRSRRLGVLYERDLHAQVADAPYLLRELAIAPIDAPASGSPRAENWRRHGKVPTLLLGATALDPARTWRFTTRWMGEPGDGPSRLRYEDTSAPELRDFRLGWAVAASSCLPASFEPLTLEGIESGRDVRLIDGGVDGDRGLSGLLDHGCSVAIFADASGKMLDAPEALAARLASGALRGFCFVHLNQDVAPHPLDRIRGNDAPRPGPTTSYGIDRELQRALCAIRTDVDTFTEVEAYALMLSGYRMTTHELQRLDARARRSGNAGAWSAFDVHARRDRRGRSCAWRRSCGSRPTRPTVRRRDLGRQLTLGAATAFRAVRLDPVLRVFAGAVAVLAIVALAAAVRRGATVTIGSAPRRRRRGRILDRDRHRGLRPPVPGLAPSPRQATRRAL